MRFYLISVLSICEGSWFLDLLDIVVLKSIFIFFTPIIYPNIDPIDYFSSNLPRFSKHFISSANLDENLISSVSRKIYGFFLSHKLNDK